MSKLISLEGLDGSGKTTQSALLLDYFNKNNYSYKYIHFPRVEVSIIGEMISKFLRGELGSIESANPYFVALMYSIDRENAKEEIKSWLTENDFVLIDRYVYSNIAFQCAKLENPAVRDILREWIIELEFKHNLIPKPDISFYLNMPFDFVINTLENERKGSERDYLKGNYDIHESSMPLQKKVEAQYLELTEIYEDFKLINCLDADKKLLSASAINDIIIKEIEKSMSEG